MFAPPPVQLSRAEIQTRLAGEKAGRKSEDGRPGRQNGDGQSISPHRRSPPSPSSPGWNHHLERVDKMLVSGPMSIGRNMSGIQDFARPGNKGLNNLPAGFGENPRRAPIPPMRIPGAFPESKSPGSDSSREPGIPPEVPPKPMRTNSASYRRAFARRAQLDHYTRSAFQARARFISRELPDTPTSIIETPIEMYHGASSMPFSTMGSPRTGIARSPLGQLSPTDAKSNGLSVHDTPISPSTLAAIPEYSNLREKSSISSGSTTPTATRLHLRGGSLLTVVPPEFTPWQRSVYIQGPVKLPSPFILPRKNSLASLEPFQEAVNTLYQDALITPRRASEDKVLDDVCDFFDGFGFCDISFGGDILVSSEDDLDENRVEYWFEGFSTPPSEPEVSPIEKIVAKAIVDGTSSMTSSSQMEDQRKDSATLSHAFLPLLPLPPQGIVGAILRV